MIRPLLLIACIVPTFLLSACINRVSQPIDTHTQFVARTLVSPECLTKCDINGDGLIQYWLWPATALWPGTNLTLSDKEDLEGQYYGIVAADLPTGANEQGVERQPERPVDGQSGDLEANANAEYECWQQCRGPGMVAAVPVAPTPEKLPMAGAAVRRPVSAKPVEAVESEAGESVSETMPY
jgi:hypothetical protein